MRKVPDPGVDFVEVEFQAVEIYVGLALNADRADSKERHARNARKAHDAIVRFLPRLQLSRTESRAFQRRLRGLTAKLDKLDDIAPDDPAHHSATPHRMSPPAKRTNKTSVERLVGRPSISSG